MRYLYVSVVINEITPKLLKKKMIIKYLNYYTGSEIKRNKGDIILKILKKEMFLTIFWHFFKELL